MVNSTTNEILNRVGKNVAPPDNDACPTLAKKAGEITTMSLLPDGDIIVPNGSSTAITVFGAQAPYVRPLFMETATIVYKMAGLTGKKESNTLEILAPTVTATIKDGSVLEIAAAKGAVPGLYPFFIGDGATGKPVSVIVQPSPEEETCKEESPTKYKKSQRGPAGRRPGTGGSASSGPQAGSGKLPRGSGAR